MDRLNQLRGEVGGSRDSTLDASSLCSESYMTANDSSKYYSLSEVDSTFDITSKDVSLTSTADPEDTITGSDQFISNLPQNEKKSHLLTGYKIGSQIEAANILSGGVNIFDDNESSYDGNELVIDDNVDCEDKSNTELGLSESSEFQKEETETLIETGLDTETAIGSKDSEVVLQIDGKNVDAIDIGNNLYLYRKEGEQELAAIQIIDDDQHHPSFKFLKVRENAEGNLEVYEEIQIEVPKEVPPKDGKSSENSSHVPIKDINKVIIDPVSNKAAEKTSNTDQKETATTLIKKQETELKDLQTENKTEVNLNGKTMKFSESRKSPLMSYHSTPSKEGIPLTKTMVDQQLHPNRHSDNVKKTIEVHTDNFRLVETPVKSKDLTEDTKVLEVPIYIKGNEESGNKLNNVELSSNELEIPEKPTIENKIKESDENLIKSQVDSEKQKLTLVSGNTTIKPQQHNVDIDTKERNESTEDSNFENKKVTEGILEENENQVVISASNKISVSEKNDASTTYSDKNIVLDNKKSEELIKTSANEENITDPMQNKISTLNTEKSFTSEDKSQLVPKTIPDIPLNENDCNNEENNISPNKVNNQLEIYQNIEPIKEVTIVSNDNKDIPQLSNDNITNESEGTTVDDTVDKSTEKIIGLETMPHTSMTTQMASSNETCNDKVKETSLNAKPLVTLLDTEKDFKHDEEKNKQIDVHSKEQQLQVVKNLSVDMKSDIEIKIKTDTQQPSQNQVVKFEEKIVKDLNSHEKQSPKPILEKNIHSLDLKSEVTDSCKNEVKSGSHVVENVIKTDKDIPGAQNINQNKLEVDGKKVVTKVDSSVDTKAKPINNNHTAVPFGKWTEANRQEFLNKIKEAKVPTNSNNTNQIKQPNDLNRRDVLKKIDSQRQMSNNAAAKIQDHKLKNETFGSKSVAKQDSKIPIKVDAPQLQNKTALKKTVANEEILQNVITEQLNSATYTSACKKESIQRKEINNQDLIDKTIEGILHKTIMIKEDSKQNVSKESSKHSKSPNSTSQTKKLQDSTLDAIEMKMNELHGIPFIERPPHELPKIYSHDQKTSSTSENPKAPNKTSKIPNLLPISNKVAQKVGSDVDLDSEEEIIEHEPITGDIDLNKIASQKLIKGTLPETTTAQIAGDTSTSEPIITENEFDKFARRNSITYENCLTVKFDGKELHNVVQTVIEKDTTITKKYSRNEALLAEAKAKAPHKPQTPRPNNHPKLQTTAKLVSISDDKTYHQSRVQVAYQSAMTVKRHMEYPITVIEDKPVKVVYMDANIDFMPTQLNVQGAGLSPPKKTLSDCDAFTTSTCDSLDSDILDTINDCKSQDDGKSKKHQRKQVLTPVETPELELIEPADLGIQVSPKKKRKTEDKIDKQKNILSRKTYLLARNTVTDEKAIKSQELKTPLQEAVNINRNDNPINRSDAVSAIDNLVKAAELLDSQSDKLNATNISNSIDSNTPQNTPIKRGRGRPRKYPLPDTATDKNKTPTPQKKLRLHPKPINKPGTSTEDDSSDDELVKENWTMGKINENIVCPICQKLFRSENVVFKHVKHCTGSSPNRSDSDSRTPTRKSRQSHDYKLNSDDDSDYEENYEIKKTPKKRKSNDSLSKLTNNEVIVIQEVKDKPDKVKESKQHRPTKLIKKTGLPLRSNNLVCEICGKTFRQLSYLVSHKLQHKKDESKRSALEDNTQTNDSVFSCDVCKKEFRKLHHLVQHRIIHNTDMPSRSLRNSTSEHTASSSSNVSKQSEDSSAAFRCEPCDKSFRKLHHLVEHRETHDGINRQKNQPSTSTNVEKPVSSPQCDICKKTFRKLHHLIEHKDQQHLETSSEKSDDKSVKSALSAKDIIHECPLCYMVFPNEHSLNKHTIICQRKKKQSATKQAKPEEGVNIIEENIESSHLEGIEKEAILKDQSLMTEEKVEMEKGHDGQIDEKPMSSIFDKSVEVVVKENPPIDLETKTIETPNLPAKRDISQIEITNTESETPTKIKKSADEEIKVKDISKKKTPKEKLSQAVTKRQKSSNLPIVPVVENIVIESSDDDDVRYMLNPDFNTDVMRKAKIFAKVKSKKRNSLQIERPNSKDLIKRRTSLQHIPKIPRLKAKPVETKLVPTNTVTLKNTPKTLKVESVPSTDSDDSDIKYSFPKTLHEKTPKGSTNKTVVKTQTKSITEKLKLLKSLTGIVKRKSISKAVTLKHKSKSPVQPVKRRTAAVEHRCDCGQLFSSAALLARHTTLAHTPPRIRRRRSPPPEISKPIVKPAPQKLTAPNKKPSVDSRKSSVRSDLSNLNKKSEKSIAASRKSGIKQKSPRKSIKNEVASATLVNASSRRTAAHRGVPVPDKMKKAAEKYKK